MLIAILLSAATVALPGGEGGIGFDDLGFAAKARKVIAPAGRTGKLDLVDPVTHEIVEIGGFSASPAGSRGHGAGVTSADEGPEGVMFAADRDTRELHAIDLAKRSFSATVKLAAGPDYVRFIAPLSEVWVTEPRQKQIEAFRWAEGKLSPAGVVKVPDGPESLAHDGERAYTHSWRGVSYAIDLRSRAVAATFENGCEGARGIAILGKLLFAGCDEGQVTAISLDSLKVVGKAPTGKGVDIIAVSPALRHVYVPAEDSKTLTIVAAAPDGGLKILRTEPAARGSHCVAADDRGNAWVCDPEHGRLLVVPDAP